MSRRRVVVTGMAGISPIGNNWTDVERALHARQNAVRYMDEWADIAGLNTRLGAPAAPFELPGHYSRKRTRSMGRVALMACLTSEWALADAGLLDHPVLKSGRTGVSCGSSLGEPGALADFAQLVEGRTLDSLTANSYLRVMAHTAPVNIAVFFGLTGRVITTSSACTSGSQGIGYAYEAIRHHYADVMVAGGSEELCASEAAVFDALFATSTRNDTPAITPRPYDRDRDGLVIGEGAGILILEELEHARARGARIIAEIVGFATNCDGAHVTQPQAETMTTAIRLALDDAGLPPSVIGYVNGHGTATELGDIAESIATHTVFGENMPFSSLKSYIGHTLGAAGAIEAWMTIEMMRTGWFAPTLNLDHVDPRCAALDYVRGDGRALDCEYAMSNNFAFGGINTSLIFKRWD
ncbi:MAG: beta-ketoacyl-ACP synthase [Azoarcus sp.]|nr:beta-ketoacyl-ACP synthase [Azoarcus sp.]